MKKIWIALFAICVFFLASCGSSFPPEFPAPDFTLTSPVTGTKVTLSELKNKPVIIYWFASW